MGDWLKYHRRIEQSVVWQDAELFRFWMWLLGRAAWRPRQVAKLGGRELGPGQVFIGTRDAAKTLRIGHQRVRTMLKLLEGCANLTREPTRHGTIITICNWTSYQKTGGPANTRKNTELTRSQHAPSKRRSLNEEYTKIPPLPPQALRTDGARTGTDGRGVGGGNGETKTMAKSKVPRCPPELDCERFRTAWGAWTEHLVQLGVPMTSVQEQAVLWNELGRLGLKEAVRAVELSTRRGWRRIYQEDRPRAVGSSSVSPVGLTPPRTAEEMRAEATRALEAQLARREQTARERAEARRSWKEA